MKNEIKELKNEELEKVSGGTEGAYNYSFRRNDHINMNEGGEMYFLVMEDVSTNDGDCLVRVTRHFRGEGASVMFEDDSEFKKAVLLQNHYNRYGGIKR